MPNVVPTNDNASTPANGAADLIRQKLAGIYQDEPDAKEELDEAEAAEHRSKHQRFMHQLSTSGKSLAQIQTEWHNYYVALPDKEKHAVWQEFYQEHGRGGAHIYKDPKAAHTESPVTHTLVKHVIPKHEDTRSVAEVREQLVGKVSRKRKKPASHLKSLAFGLMSGMIAVVILLFGFFNERFIAPFISPSKNISDSSIIIDPGLTPAGSNPEIIIPKINVDIPVVYDEPSIADQAVQSALERGVLHYATTPNPGEKGNGVIFGHSSNNILNKGKYKFAFVLLRRLEVGDTFIIQKDGKRYVYKVFETKVVDPKDVSVLTADTGKPASFSLITCDPPGTTLKRLVVTGEQITPDPATNTTSTAPAATSQPAIIPSNSESLWHRITHWFSS